MLVLKPFEGPFHKVMRNCKWKSTNKAQPVILAARAFIKSLVNCLLVMSVATVRKPQRQ